MGYRLSVDLGTTNTAAVVHRPGSAPAVVSLGTRSATMPSVLFLGPDGVVLMGEAAERRALTHPEHVVRRFKRRIGDEMPLLVGAGGDGLPAHTIAAWMIALVADQVAAQEGGAPDAIAVTVPAAWGAHKKDLLSDALAREGLLDVTMVPEPAAAALAYAQTGRLGAGTTVAVYDLGGGTFDAAVLRAGSDGRFTALGTPCGIPNLGGIDFDDAVLAYTLGITGPQTPGIDHDDPIHLTALARLRRECVEAKEALSVDTVATVPVMLGGAQTSVRLTRTEFEAMIAGAVEETCAAMEAALDSAGQTRESLDRILLAGGSSRIPLVTQLLSARYPEVALDRDIDPKLAVAIGAVLALEQGDERYAAAPSAVEEVAVTVGGGALVAAAMSAGPARPALERETFDGHAEPDGGCTVVHPRRRASRVLLALAGVALIGGTTLTNVGALELGDVLPNGTLREARGGVPAEGAELVVEGTDHAKTEVRSTEATEPATETAADVTENEATDSTITTESSDSSAATASGRTEGSADSRSAEWSGSDEDAATDAAGADDAAADSTSAEVAEPASTKDRSTDGKATRAERPQRPVADPASAPAIEPVDAAAAPGAVEAPAEDSAPAAQEEDTTTESGSVEFDDTPAEEPPAAPGD